MTKKRSKINELEELKLDMRKISNDMEEMCGILNLYMYEDLNYRLELWPSTLLPVFCHLLP